MLSLSLSKSKKENHEIILVKKAIHGDSNAYTDLIKSYKVYLYKIAYSYVKDESKALDILQECTFKGLLSIKRLRNPQLFKTWITKILINSALALINKESNIIYLDDSAPITYLSNSISIEEKLDLYNAIDLLRPNYKTAIILKYFNDMTINDISYIMEIPINTVKSHLRRAKDDLSKILKEDYLND